jgi:hypothetical protein
MAQKKKAPIALPQPEVQVETTRVARSNPTVFISHDGRDADLAEAFCNLLTDVSGGILKPFCSSDKKGTRGAGVGPRQFIEIIR